MTTLKLFKPEVFQGSLKKKHYFEGWYFKHVSEAKDQVYAFIPGISLSKDDPHAFIQVISGLTHESFYISYPISSFSWKNDRLLVQVGESVFSNESIILNIDEKDIQVYGRLDYSGLTPYPKKLLSPGIMGWYSYVPFMECYHGVVSANHKIDGHLHINTKKVDFTKGKGYIEKDWGTSFPECWIWVQSNSFDQTDASLFASIAKIPWLGSYFMGFIAFLYLNGKYYPFATYNRSSLETLSCNGNHLNIHLLNRKYRLDISVEVANASELIAPERGSMNRRIKESIDSKVEVKLQSRSRKVIFNARSDRAGLEVIDKIFDYF